MRQFNQYSTRRRMSQSMLGGLAFLALLSPLSMPTAKGQVSLTITILINAASDEPSDKPAIAPSSPEAPQVEPPQAEPPQAEPPQAELPPVEPPQTEPPATEGTASPAETIDPASINPESAESTSIAEPASSGTQEATESVSQSSAEANSKTSDATNSSALAEVTTLPAEGTSTDSANEPASPTPPLVQPLSVEPAKSLLPEDRPNWITLEPDYATDTHRFVVSSIPTTHESDVDANLDAPLEEAVRSYVAEQFGDDRAGTLLSSRLSSAFVRANLIDDKKSYTAELTTTSGGMFQKWVMVEVTKEQREELQTWYREQMQRERILPLGLGVAGLLGMVGLLNMVFRRAAGKASSQPLKLAMVDPVLAKSTCCNTKGSWGIAVAIAIAIAVAIFAG